MAKSACPKNPAARRAAVRDGSRPRSTPRVARANAAIKALLADRQHDLEHLDPDAREQMDAYALAHIESLARYFKGKRQPRTTRPQPESFPLIAREADEAGTQAARAVAEAQLQRRIDAWKREPSGRPPSKVRSLFDGWKFPLPGRHGRRSEYDSGMLMMVVMVAGAQDEAEREGTRLSCAAAIADHFAGYMRARHPPKYLELQSWRAHFEEQGASPRAALTRAAKKVLGSKKFRRLEVFASRVLNRARTR